MRPYAFLRYAAVCFLLPFLACQAQAFVDNELTIGMGGMVYITPYKSYDTQSALIPIVSYEGKYAYVREFSAGVKLVNLDFLEISAFAEYDYTCFKPRNSSDARLRKLSNRRDSMSLGTAVRLITPYGMLHASGAHDVLGRNNGLTGLIGYMNSVEFGPLELIPAAGVQWSNNSYNNYYYGVSGEESRKSGLNSHHVGSGVSPYTGLTIDYSLTKSWEIYYSGEWIFLNSAIKNSPMVSRTNTYSLMLGLSYTF